MSTPTRSLQAARSWLVIGPGAPSPTSRLSIWPTGRIEYGVLQKKCLVGGVEVVGLKVVLYGRNSECVGDLHDRHPETHPAAWSCPSAF